MTQITTLKATVTVALRMSATQAARKLGKAHAEQGIRRLGGMNLYNAIIASSTKDIRAYNADILAFPKVTSDEDRQAAVKLYGEVFYPEYDKAYARFTK